jgi:hypothetical protein
MSWHYLPVYQDTKWEFKGEPQITRSFGFIEVYLDDDGKLEMWSQWDNPEKAQAPYGETIKELRGDLDNMLNDINRWQPENYEELKTGMRFKRRKTNYRERRQVRLSERAERCLDP